MIVHNKKNDLELLKRNGAIHHILSINLRRKIYLKYVKLNNS